VKNCSVNEAHFSSIVSNYNTFKRNTRKKVAYSTLIKALIFSRAKSFEATASPPHLREAQDGT